MAIETGILKESIDIIRNAVCIGKFCLQNLPALIAGTLHELNDYKYNQQYEQYLFYAFHRIT